MCNFIKHLSVLYVCSTLFVNAQENKAFRIHSHNDYHQNIPFWKAFSNGLTSIEVDVFLKNDSLYVTHGESEIIRDRTIESLYLEPLQKVIDLKLGKLDKLQLLVDFKSEAYTSLNKLISALKKYPDIINDSRISIVISGNRPKLEEYKNYPPYIHFDYQSLKKITEDKTLSKIALISLNFKKTSSWNGKGKLTKSDHQKVSSVITQAHQMNKPFRFWGIPDSKTAWKTMKEMGVDFINTDDTVESSIYLQSLDHRIYHNKNISSIYIPTFESDQKNIPVENIILLIGDGNGLAQITAAEIGNAGRLTLTQLKSIGLVRTQTADDFTTDSAAAATAMATGIKTYNRYLGLDPNGQPTENITELLNKKGYSLGLITTDHITGATPAAFYSHQADRSQLKEISQDLIDSKISLFIGGGANDFQGEEIEKNFEIVDHLEMVGKSRYKKVGHFLSKNDVPPIKGGRNVSLSNITVNGLAFLQKKNTPFFLMIEGAQIDSFGHKNDISGMISEGIDFDSAVAEAIKFSDTTGNTLVIVTADHETSGLSLPGANPKSRIIEADFSTNDHSTIMIPLFAYGPQSSEFQGVYENNEVFHKILKVLGASQN
jgi:alkaline phosphatase